MNVDKIVAHRGLMLTALSFYGKQLEKIKKLEEDAEVSSDDTTRAIAAIENLRADLVDQRTLLLEGTPMGDELTRARWTAADGTELTVDVLDALLFSVGVDVPLEEITKWPLEYRHDVHRYAVALQESILNGTDAPPAPDGFNASWITDRDGLLERELPETAIDELITVGPWGVGPKGGDPTSTEWEVHRITQPTEGDYEVVAQVHSQTYGQLDRARLIAANLNALEEGKARLEQARTARVAAGVANASDTSDTSAVAPAGAASDDAGPEVHADEALGDPVVDEDDEEEDAPPPRKKRRLTHRKIAKPSKE